MRVKVFVNLAVILSSTAFILAGCDKDTPTEPEETLLENRMTEHEIELANANSDFDSYEYDSNDYIPHTEDFDEAPLLLNAATPDPSSPTYLMVGRIQYILDNLQTTQYVHYCGHKMDESRGIYKYDCSGFVGEFVLKQVLPNHYDDLLAASSRLHPHDLRPRAWAFYDYFRDDILGSADSTMGQNSYWKVFTNIDSVRRGDIIVARYHDDWRSAQIAAGKSASTGHVMIAWSDAHWVDDHKIKIKITDCSGSGHYNDTRPIDNTNYPSDYHPVNSSGIGSGWMWYGISTNGHNRPYKYQWRSSSGKEYTLRSVKPNDNKYGRLEGIIIARPIGNI